MKHSRLIFGLTVVCLLLSITACGSGEPTIETPAAEMNLTVADLGPEWSLQQEQGKDELATTLQAGDLVDADMRIFAAAANQTMLVSQLISVKSVVSAKTTMAGEFVQAFTTGMQSLLPGVTLEELASPNVGEESVLMGGNVPDLDFNVYILAFRKTNVIATLFLMGPAESATEESVADYARKVEAKLH